MTKASVEAAQLLFDSQNIPQTGRYMLLDAYMYNQLKNSMTNNEVVAFLAGADPEKASSGNMPASGSTNAAKWPKRPKPESSRSGARPPMRPIRQPA